MLRTDMSVGAPCRIGVAGTFDTETFGDAILVRVLGRELGARLPGADVQFGLTDQQPDVVVDAAGDACVLAPRLFSPDLLAKRLEYCWLMGWYPPEGAVALVDGDGRLLSDAPVLAESLAGLASTEPELRVVVAELGSEGAAAFASALTGAFTGALEEARAGALPATAYRLPAYAGLEDIAAAIAHSALVVTASARTALVAEAYERSAVLLAPGAPPGVEALRTALRADPPSRRVAALITAADADLDRIAQAAAAASPSYEAPSQKAPSQKAPSKKAKETPVPDPDRLAEAELALQRLRVAHEARSRRLGTERMVFANHLHKAEADIAALRAEVARLAEQMAHAETRLAEAVAATQAEAKARSATEAELAGLRATRTFRYTAELRNVYARLRRMSDADDEARGG